MFQSSSVQFSRSVVSDSLRPHVLQHARLPCPSSSPGAYSLMSIRSVMPSIHLILCCLLLLPPSIIPSIRVFSSESALQVRRPKHWTFSFSIGPSNEYSGLISFRIDWLGIAVERTLRSLPQHLNLKGQFFSTLSSLWSNSHIHTCLLEKPWL